MRTLARRLSPGVVLASSLIALAGIANAQTPSPSPSPAPEPAEPATTTSAEPAAPTTPEEPYTVRLRKLEQ